MVRYPDSVNSPAPGSHFSKIFSPPRATRLQSWWIKIMIVVMLMVIVMVLMKLRMVLQMMRTTATTVCV